MTNRITGPGQPDPNRGQDSKVNREASQRIEKVREVDPDEQAQNRKRNQFKMMMDDTDDDVNIPDVSPSPVDPKFYQSQANPAAMPGVDDAAVASPSASPPPDVNVSLPGPQLSNEDLPQSNQFWNNVGLPDQPVQPVSTQLQSGTSQTGEPKVSGGVKGKKGDIGVPIVADKSAAKKGSEPFLPPPGSGVKGHKSSAKPLEPSPFGPPGKPEKAAQKKQEDDGAAPSGRYWTEEGRVEPGVGIKNKEKSPMKGTEGSPFHEKASSKDIETTPPSYRQPDTFAGEPLSAQQEEQQEKKGKGKGHSKEEVSIVAPSATPLPQDIQPYALAAATYASPYLRPEVLPLFYQMVGSIMVMSTPPGISRTEVILNGAGFTNSKFFGAKIEITKYSTAPDSLNIRLTGSNEAVKSFNQNIPSLMASFQSGKFNFRIGRLDASYESDRPLVRRKKGEEGTDADAGGDQR